MRKALLDTSVNIAASLVDDFVAHKILNEITGQRRNRPLLFTRYIAMFSKRPD